MKNQRGFTIIEVMVATMITGILIIIIMSFLGNTIARNATATARADMLREAQLTLDNIGREIRHSSGADLQNRWPDENAPDAPTDEFSWASDADTLVLATAATDSSNNIIFTDALHYVTSKNNNIYFVDNGVLYKRTLADPIANNSAQTSCPPNPSDACPDDRELVHNVSDFSIRYFNNQDLEVPPTEARSVELSISMQKIRYGYNLEVDFTTRTVFRSE